MVLQKSHERCGGRPGRVQRAGAADARAGCGRSSRGRRPKQARGAWLDRRDSSDTARNRLRGFCLLLLARAGTTGLVAEASGHVLGIGVLRDHDSDESELAGILALESRKRGGIGSADEGVAAGLTAPHRRIVVTTEADNLPAISLSEKHGFAVTDRATVELEGTPADLVT